MVETPTRGILVIVVQYRPQADQADHNQALVEDVFAELHGSTPGGVRYATFRLADGSFLHIADVEADPNPLSQVAAFARFQDGIGDRCDEGHGPNAQPATLVGNYRLLP